MAPATPHLAIGPPSNTTIGSLHIHDLKEHTCLNIDPGPNVRSTNEGITNGRSCILPHLCRHQGTNLHIGPSRRSRQSFVRSHTSCRRHVSPPSLVPHAFGVDCPHGHHYPHARPPSACDSAHIPHTPRPSSRVSPCVPSDSRRSAIQHVHTQHANYAGTLAYTYMNT